MSGAKHRQKGDRCERELVELHRALGIHAERYPLSGASRFRGSVAECRARKNGDGFLTLEGWLADYDALFLRRDRAEPLVVLPWRVWAKMIKR
jgi:Holliday junction resolvase